MPWLPPRVNDQRPAAAPMFVLGEAANSFNVTGRIAARERDPQKIVERARGKFAVIDEHYERKLIEGMIKRHSSAKSFEQRIMCAAALWLK